MKNDSTTSTNQDLEDLKVLISEGDQEEQKVLPNAAKKGKAMIKKEQSLYENNRGQGNRTLESTQYYSQDGLLQMMSLAGAEEIGMNMTVYLYEKDSSKFAILVDCGVGFENLPGANVVIPNVDVLNNLGIKISAIVITHGHEDHIGSIPHLIDKLQVPIYATPFTSELIKKKMEYARKKNYKIEVIRAGDIRDIGPFKIHWINATHSIPDNTMVGIEVGGVRVLQTGDWKDDPSPTVGEATDFEAIKAFAAKGVHALVSDSTNIHQENISVSEKTVAQSIKQLLLTHKKGKFILTCFASNISRVQGCFEAARAANRKVLVLGTSLKKAVEIATDLGYMKVSDVLVTDEEANNIASDDLMILSTGSQAEENSALWKMANEMRSIGTTIERNDTLVFSARVIDGRQQAIRKVINKLVDKGVRIIHPWNSLSCIHASGHPTKPDVMKLLDLVKPKYVIPVHSEAEHRVSHIAFAQSKGYKTFNLHNGVMIGITKDEVFQTNVVEVNKLVLDGSRLVGHNSEIFLKRLELQISGLIAVSITVRGQGFASMISNVGVFDDKVDIKNKNTLNKNLKLELDRLLKTFPVSSITKKGATKAIYAMRSKILSTLKKYIWNAIKKNPIINIQILT